MYLKDEKPFMAITGEPLKVQGETGELVDGDLRSVLETCLNTYVPPQGQAPTTEDWRAVNVIFGVLEEGPDDGYYAFETAHFNVLKGIIGYVAPLILRRNSPHLLDSLNGATDKKAA